MRSKGIWLTVILSVSVRLLLDEIKFELMDRVKQMVLPNMKFPKGMTNKLLKRNLLLQ